VRSPWLIAVLLASTPSLAGCVEATEELTGTGTGPRVTGEPSGPSTTVSAPTPAAVGAERPSPAPTAPAGLPASKPARVEIPALGVAQRTIELELAADGTMEVPVGPEPVGWFAESPTPGEIGPAVLAGHVTWNGVTVSSATSGPWDVAPRSS
jgi:hypothetical protein